MTMFNCECMLIVLRQRNKMAQVVEESASDKCGLLGSVLNALSLLINILLVLKNNNRPP